MNMRAPFLELAGVCIFSVAAFGQGRPSGDFQISKISKNFVTSPQYTYTGGQQFRLTNRIERFPVFFGRNVH